MTDYSGVTALIMGLGLHGGGLESARFLARRGADIWVTDLRDEETLRPSIEKLDAALAEEGRPPARYILGRHETADFERADIVVKNPGVKPGSPYLAAARRIETDISLFLSDCPARIIAVTGSKGKSTSAAALHHALTVCGASEPDGGRAFLGGNITVSPLTFLDELKAGDDVVLELSSWQLADLRGRGLLKPKAALVTAIMADHQNWYTSMESYVADKRVIGAAQDGTDIITAPYDEWGKSFFAASRARPLAYGDTIPDGVSGGWLEERGPGLLRFCENPPPDWPANAAAIEVVPARPRIPGVHQKRNLLGAAVTLCALGLPPEKVCGALGSFGGIEHRLECFLEKDGRRHYNDTAATIPEAAAAAVEALAAEDRAEGRVVLVAGGADKNLDFRPLATAAASPAVKVTILLDGSGTPALKALLDEAGAAALGPFGTVEEAAAAALDAAGPGCRTLLSPGCASFGMFQNEFDRGRRWKEAVTRLAGA